MSEQAEFEPKTPTPQPAATTTETPPSQPAAEPRRRVVPNVIPRIPDALKPTIGQQPIQPPPAASASTAGSSTDSLKGLLAHLMNQFLSSLKTRLIVMAVAMIVIFCVNTWLVAVVNDGFGTGPHWWWIRQIATLHGWIGHGVLRTGLVWSLLAMIIFGIIGRYRRMGRQAAGQAYRRGFSRWLQSWLLPAGSPSQVLHTGAVLVGFLFVLLVQNAILTLLLGLALFLSVCVLGDSLLITALNAGWQDWHRRRKATSPEPFPAEQVMVACRGFSFGLVFFALLYFLLDWVHLPILMLIPFLALVAWLVLNAIKLSKPVQVGAAMFLICLACLITPAALAYADDGGLSEAGGNWWNWMTSEGAVPLYQDSATAAGLGAFGAAGAAGFNGSADDPGSGTPDSPNGSKKRRSGKDFSHLGWKQDDQGNWWRTQTTPDFTINYQYDQDGRLKTRVRTEANQSYTVTSYQVDSNGQIIGSDNTRCNPDGTVTERWLEKGDHNGNTTRSYYTLDQYDFRDGHQQPHITRTETTNGQFTTETKNYRPDGTLRNEFTYKKEYIYTNEALIRETYMGAETYTETGTIIHYDETGTVEIGRQNIVYDADHNVVSSQCVDAHGNPISQVQLNQMSANN